MKGNNHTPTILTRVLEPEIFLKVHTYVKHHGASINDAFLTAYIRALHDLFGWTTIKIPCPVDLRRFNTRSNHGSICNLTGNYDCKVALEGTEPFETTLVKVSLQMNAQKASKLCLKGPLFFHLIYHIVPYCVLKKLFFKLSPVSKLSYTNLGNLDEEKLRFKGTKVTDVFLATATKPVPYFQLTASTYKNRCTLSACTCAQGSDLALITRLMDLVYEQLVRTL